MAEVDGTTKPKSSIYHENPVIVNEALGTIFLGLLSLALLVALLRSEAAQRRLLRKMAATDVANDSA